ncbi:MAG TPA: sigma-70 family RNA polymerase sigma factor [Candidatus Limiplasma sp.]|nr:sigma-70 family RNA polymerase sigma factor [Candidatus Limiplasma sp.]
MTNDERMGALFTQYAQTRAIEIRDQLVEGYLPLAKAVARRFEGRGIETEDLQQVASIALIKAVERFDPARGFRFVTYAVPTIAGDVRNYIRDKMGGMRMPRDLRSKLYHMQQVREQYELEHLREPSAKELAAAMKITPDELLMLLDMRKQTDIVSLDAPISEEHAAEIGAFLGTEDKGFEQVEHAQWMDWVYSKVDEKERKLLNLRYAQRMGQREVAKALGVSQMQVSRMERRVLQRLRAIEESGV